METKCARMSFRDVLLQTIQDPKNRVLPRHIDGNGLSYCYDDCGNRRYDAPVFADNIMYYAKNSSGQIKYRMNKQGIIEHYCVLSNGIWQQGSDGTGFIYYQDNNGIRFRINNKGTLEYELSHSKHTSEYVSPDNTHVFYKHGKHQYRKCKY